MASYFSEQVVTKILSIDELTFLSIHREIQAMTENLISLIRANNSEKIHLISVNYQENQPYRRRVALADRANL